MSFFKQPKPRSFHHEMIYVDERAERLAGIERRAKEKMGMIPQEGYDSTRLRQAFRQGRSGRKRHTAASWNFGLLALLLALLFLLGLYLI